MTTAPLTYANGATHPAAPPAMPLLPRGPVSPWPRDDSGTAPRDVAPAARRSVLRDVLSFVASRLHVPDGDAVITWAMGATVAVVAVDAAIVSYSHIYALATGAPGNGVETGIQPRLLPLSIDGVIAEASLILLYAARHKLQAPRLATLMLWLGIAATVAANVAHGLPSSLLSSTTHAVISALLSAWPAGAFIGSVEMAMGLVRATRAVADDGTGGARTPRRATRRPRRGARPRKPHPKPPGTPPGVTAAPDPVAAAVMSHPAWKARRKLTRDDKAEIAKTAGVTVRSVERCLKDPRRVGPKKAAGQP
jgi:hypothetical protein